MLYLTEKTQGEYVALSLRGGNRSNKRSMSVGFALPTILISSIVMLTVLLISITSSSAIRTSVQSQYYQQLAQVAGEAGVAYAQACIAANGAAQWTNAKPLTPASDCSGNTPDISAVARVLVVAGGGGGGSDMGGGGGGGGVLSNNAYALAAQAYTVTVGAGGAGAPAGVSQVRGTNGSNSIFGTMTAIGGGGGASEYSTNGSPPGNGGSGGGNAGCNQTTGPGTGTAGQGYNGAWSGCYYPSGGGGAGGPGATNPGNGGPGILNDILGTPYYWGGGGGGSGYVGPGGNGGIGGGGGGAIGITTGGVGFNNGSPGTDGAAISQANVPGGNAGANTGGGGGGGSHYNSNNKGGNGGSGIVVISYPTGRITATGGTITTSGTNTVHTFTGSGTFTVTAINTFTCPSNPKCFVMSNGNIRSSFSVPGVVLSSTVRALIVAGGGSGGGSTGGGGGGGGVLDQSNMSVDITNYPVIVGAGGAIPGNKLPGLNGSNSSFNNLTAIGGGGGGYSNGTIGGPGQDGGSGGGGQTYLGIYLSGNGTLGQGNPGGNFSSDGDWAYGGGGAGSGGGVHVSTNAGGYGGNGLRSDISGSSVFYGGGGGGGNGGLATLGGAGNGSASGSGGVGSSATANTGGGGGGGWDYATGNGGAGGSGIVIISYPTGSMTATGGAITTSGGNTIHTFTTNGTFQVTAITPKVISNSGYVQLLRSNGAVWRTYNQPTAQPTVVADQCSGAASSIYGWNNAVVRSVPYSIAEPSAKAIGIASSDQINTGPKYFRKDFSVAKAGTYTLSTASRDSVSWYLDNKFLLISNYQSTTATSTSFSLSAGCHTLTAKSVNTGILPGSSDFMASLELSGTSIPLVVTNQSWRVTSGNLVHYSSANYYVDPTAWTNALNVRNSTASDATWAANSGDSTSLFIASPSNNSGGNYPFAKWTNFRDGRDVTVASNTDAKVTVQCDDNCIVYMDGNQIISNAPWSSDYSNIITIPAGTHHFGVALNNTGTAAGVSGFSLAVVRKSDGAVLTHSDTSWLGANYWNATNQDPYSYDNTFLATPTPSGAVAAKVLAIGGGGAGGTSSASSGGGGGGGAGGYVYNAAYTLVPDTYAITVGGGGTAATTSNARGGSGGQSIFGNLVAYGGGGGGGSLGAGAIGGSGGGAGYLSYTFQAGAFGIVGQGNAGGNTLSNNNGGGGGGAGGAGGNTNNTGGSAGGQGGVGGIGLANSITGSSVTYAKGGEGGTPPGGFANGAANTGNGGSGIYGATSPSGAGGSGVVIISFPTNSLTFTQTNGTVTTISSGTITVVKFVTSGSFTVTSIP